MAVSGYTTIGISNAADSLLNQLHDLQGGQKRELVSNLLTGLLVSEAGIIDAILNAGKMASSAFNSGVEPALASGVTFPIGHFMEGFSAEMTLEKMSVNVKRVRDEINEANAKSTQPVTEEETKAEYKKGKGK